MDFLHFFALLSLLAVLCKGEGGLSKPRSGRKYDTQYGPPGNYMDSSDDADDAIDDQSGSAPSDPPSPQPNRQAYGYPSKGGYPAVQSYGQKGYPFNPYYWKGFTKASDASPMKAVEMMMMMDAMDQIREQEKSGISKFFSDSKSVLMASVVPLSLILAAVVPVLLNYSMTGQGATQTVSSTAGGRGFRSVADGTLEKIVRNFEEMARAVDEDDCLQRALCRVASNTSSNLGPDVRRVAATVAGLVGDEWAVGAGLKGFVSGLRQRSCEDVCEQKVQNNLTKNVTKN